MDSYTQPDFLSCALITIDTQQDTLDGQPIEIPGTSAILPQMQKVLDMFREKKKPIVHIVRIYKKDGSNVDLCRREAVINGAPILLENSAGSQLACELQLGEKSKLKYDDLLDGKIQVRSSKKARISGN